MFLVPSSIQFRISIKPLCRSCCSIFNVIPKFVHTSGVKVADDDYSNGKDKKMKPIKSIPKNVKNHIHSERLFNKHLFGPLLESKREKKKRLALKPNENDNQMSNVATLGYSKLRKRHESFREYEKFAAVYSNISDADTSVEMHENPLQVTAFSDDLRESTYKSAIPEETILSIDNSKYVDAPKDIKLEYISSFPLFNNETTSMNYLEHHPKSSATSSEEEKCNGIRGMISKPDKKVPSVSHILSTTMSDVSRANLARWEAQMIAKLGLEGFQQYKAQLFSHGSLLHRCIQTQLQDHQAPSSQNLEQLKGSWQSIEATVQQVEESNAVYALESAVVHPHLHYAGIIDCVAEYRGVPVIIEWKTSTKVKRTLQSTYDNPVQLAAYLGAMQYDPRFSHLRDVQSGLLAFSYEGGKIGDTHILTPAVLQVYWNMWLERLAMFWKLHALTS